MDSEPSISMAAKTLNFLITVLAYALILSHGSFKQITLSSFLMQFLTSWIFLFHYA